MSINCIFTERCIWDLFLNVRLLHVLISFKFPFSVQGAFLHHVEEDHVTEKRPLQENKNMEPHRILTRHFYFK